jgi:hypothetical protein
MPSTRRKQTTPANDDASPVLHVIENKREKFRRLANQRAKPLIKRMRLMGNLGGNAYEAGPDDIERIAAALGAEYDAMLLQLRRRASKSTELADIL